MKHKNKNNHQPKGFWENETCEYCDGQIVEKVVDLPRRLGKKYVLIKNVPVGVCQECGTRYYAANILKAIDTLIKSKRKPQRQISMPVYSL